MKPNAFIIYYYYFLVSLGIFQLNFLAAQSNIIGPGQINWNMKESYAVPLSAESFSNSDLVVLSEHTEFHFFNLNNEKITRNIKFKINTQKGLDILKNFKTPESFDFGYDSELFKQGRRTRTKIPLIMGYQIKTFAARKFSNGQWKYVNGKEHFERIKWMRRSGEFAQEDMLIVQLQSLQIGDVVEVFYEALFDLNYGNNIFYFNGPFPKLNCEYDFIYRLQKGFNYKSFLLFSNIKDSLVRTNVVDKDGLNHITTKIQFSNLKANIYPNNSLQAKQLPNVEADFKFYRTMTGYNDVNGFVKTYVKPTNFEWIVFTDTTTNQYTKVYDKSYYALQKFVKTLPPFGSDSQNVVFIKALCDTFNNFRFISANQLYYNESQLYDLHSSEHLLKRRLSEHFGWKLYVDLLENTGIFYYLVNVQDRRLGEHHLQKRTHEAYQDHIIAIPNKNSFVYFVPRVDGLKYHLNELPFYHEGTYAALFPKNFQEQTPDKANKIFKMIKTHKGTFNENTRSESAMIKVNLDSLNLNFQIKESLSGQFSTILRHYYLGELVDSTISLAYFKKCTDKPASIQKKVKLSSFNSEFPFRYNFNCSIKTSMLDAKSLSLKNWFSFPISKQTIPFTPNFDYYFDFNFSDVYNFMFETNKSVELINASLFETQIDNDYFKLESSVKQNAENSFLLKLNFQVKKEMIPYSQIALLTDLLKRVEELNNFKLEFK